MNLEEALALLQPPPGHNTILSKEAIDVVCNAARFAGREVVARWMMENGYATGHGDTIADLLVELEEQARTRAEADANRLAEAARQISQDIYISDYDIPQDRSLLVKARQLQALVDALAEHDKPASG